MDDTALLDIIRGKIDPTEMFWHPLNEKKCRELCQFIDEERHEERIKQLIKKEVKRQLKTVAKTEQHS